MRRSVLAVFLIAAACDKSGASASTAPPVADADPLDQATTVLVAALQQGDYDGLRKQTVDPLTGDLSRPEFDDLSAIVKWLGPLQSRTETKTDEAYGGGQRWYELKFEKASPVELEVSIDPQGKLTGFEFRGDGYTEAERGVLAEPWREFKVYDFHYLGADGTRLPAGSKITGTRIDYEIVVGGIEAFIGEHHLKIEKVLLDAQGNELFAEPVEFDAKFAQDSMGIPRGVVRGYLDVPGPGQYQLQLRITDENSSRQVEHRESCETVAK